MSSFIGHFHPVFVHLPIGILLLAFVLQAIAKKKGTTDFDKAISVSLLIGMLSAVLSCITGYILSRTDDYDEQLVSRHQWLGISVALIAAVLYGLQKRNKAVRWHWPLMIVLFLLVTITGHIGGSLTHGSDYLTAPLTGLMKNDTASERRAPIPNVQEAVAYQEIIQPLLQNKCYSCHNKNKQKGGLRMDEQALLLKGGKNGLVLIPGKALESDLIKRISLPREDDDHMPPKEKPQLTEKEIALLHWWVTVGASFDKKVKQLEQPEAIKPLLAALENAPEKKASAAIPAEPVEQANDSALQRLRTRGVVVLPVAKNSNYLSANFITATGVQNKDLELLLPVKKQLVWLKLSNTGITDSALQWIGQCDHITRLQIDRTPITDKGLQYLSALKKLQYLNLVGTKVTAAGLLQLKTLKELQSVYCYQAGIRPDDWAMLKKAFPKVSIDTGGYQVPLLPTDTMLVKPPVQKTK
jgi:uncharacterized membrane protein/mono/diheme cytochrome c family protein